MDICSIKARQVIKTYCVTIIASGTHIHILLNRTNVSFKCIFLNRYIHGVKANYNSLFVFQNN